MVETPDNFLGLEPKLCDPKTARYAVLPVPYEGTVSYAKGTADGPAAIIEASQQVEWFDDELQAEFYQAGVATCDAVEPTDDPGETMRRVAAAAKPLVDAGKFLLTLGGEHSITAPLVREVARVHGPLSVLQIDAHADLRDSYGGTKHSHAAVMRRVRETADGICQVGIRNYSQEEFDACPREVANFITPRVVRSDPKWIDRALTLLGEKVYVTVDIDG
ncbi:MAG: arginase family protein, partial [Planctomycetes bacterium]|nr:arginase family protein [Planctomycetota bacterium]